MEEDAVLQSLRDALATRPDDVPLRLHFAQLLLDRDRHTEAIAEAAIILQDWCEASEADDSKLVMYSDEQGNVDRGLHVLRHHPRLDCRGRHLVAVRLVLGGDCRRSLRNHRLWLGAGYGRRHGRRRWVLFPISLAESGPKAVQEGVARSWV